MIRRETEAHVLTLLRNTTDREKSHQLQVVVHSGAERIEGRLCWLRLPEDKAAEARCRAERDADGPCDTDTLDAAEYVVVFTSVMKELSAAEALELYRIRWQVELEFKRSKSIQQFLDPSPQTFCRRQSTVGFVRNSYCRWSRDALPRQMALFPPEPPAGKSCPPARASNRRVAIKTAIAEPWYVVQLAWSLVCNATLPITLRDLPSVLGTFVEHIGRENRTRTRQIDRIRNKLGEPDRKSSSSVA